MSKVRKKIKTKVLISNTISYIILITIALVCAGPFIWLLLSSLRTGANIYDLNFTLKSFSISNYTGVMEFMKLHKYVWNTVVITGGAIAIDVVFSAMCAYPLATMNFKGKNVIFAILVATMIIPAAAGMIINYLTISRMHLLDNVFGVILPSSVKTFGLLSFLGRLTWEFPKNLLMQPK